MRCVIVEDEMLAAEKLAGQLAAVAPDIVVDTVLPSVAEAVKWFTMNQADLAFFDINLSDGSSFSVFEMTEVDCPVIFTTAYDEFAIKAFKHNSIDYLLKPVNSSELLAAIRKFRKMRRSSLPDLQALKQILSPAEPDYQSRLLIQFGDKLKTIEVKEVAYFQSLAKSVFLTTTQGQSFAVDFTLDKLETMLDPRSFFRINRKIILSVSSIVSMTAYSRGRVMIQLKPALSDPTLAMVSVERAQDFRRWLGERK